MVFWCLCSSEWWLLFLIKFVYPGINHLVKCSLSLSLSPHTQTHLCSKPASLLEKQKENIQKWGWWAIHPQLRNPELYMNRCKKGFCLIQVHVINSKHMICGRQLISCPDWSLQIITFVGKPKKKGYRIVAHAATCLIWDVM